MNNDLSASARAGSWLTDLQNSSDHHVVGRRIAFRLSLEIQNQPVPQHGGAITAHRSSRATW